jgi:hypothetical protein
MAKVKIAKLTDWQLINGTCLQGYVNVDYATLVNVFGEPEGAFDNYKSDCAWDLLINGTVVTIYNYKDGKNYNGPAGLAIDNITDWHVGGKSKLAQQLVDKAIEQYFAKQKQIA